MLFIATPNSVLLQFAHDSICRYACQTYLRTCLWNNAEWFCPLIVFENFLSHAMITLLFLQESAHGKCADFCS